VSLQDIQWVDLWHEHGFDRLVSAIEHALGGAPTMIIGFGAENGVLQETLEEKVDSGTLPKPGTVFRDKDAEWCPELVVTPPGEFMMGSTEAERQWAIEQGAKREWLEREKPQHLVRIAYPLAVGRYPVTFEEYGHFARTTGRAQPEDGEWGRGRRPVINVDWEDAKSFAAWLSVQTGQSYRLLSEAEWEYACRAGTTSRYWWGDEITPENANYGPNVGKTTEVGEYPANLFGLYDMHGNVWEWVEDWWQHSYKGAPPDGSAWTVGNTSRRALRGGSWSRNQAGVRSASRTGRTTDFRESKIGFRVARPLLPSESAT
jgi:formylglycine-generating enzyme required for sulfatase activity